MTSITQRHGALDRWNGQRARRQVETALSPRRFARRLSVATPALRAFARAGLWSLLLWAAILLAAAARLT